MNRNSNLKEYNLKMFGDKIKVVDMTPPKLVIFDGDVNNFNFTKLLKQNRRLFDLSFAALLWGMTVRLALAL